MQSPQSESTPRRLTLQFPNFRSSIVNNRTQAVVCDDLGITEYALFAVPKKDLKVKDRADLLEAFLGALYVDKDLEYCQVFAAVCFFPR